MNRSHGAMSSILIATLGLGIIVLCIVIVKRQMQPKDGIGFTLLDDPRGKKKMYPRKGKFIELL